MADLWFANGVAMGPGGDYVLVVETNGFRILRKWLKGPKTGEVDVLIDKLPGYPDGMSRASDGNFWVCLVVCRCVASTQSPSAAHHRRFIVHCPRLSVHVALQLKLSAVPVFTKLQHSLTGALAKNPNPHRPQ